MKILYIFPQPGAPYSRKQIVEQAEAGTLPDTLLMGANRIPQYGIDVDCLFASDYSIAGRPPRYHLQQQFSALRRQDEYDLIVCKDLTTGIILGFLRRAGILRVPIVLLDLVISEETPFQDVLSESLKGFDKIICASPRMQTYAQSKLGISEEHVTMYPWAIDTDFWNSTNTLTTTDDQLIISCGSNHRDYQTLIDALRPTGYQVEIITQTAIPTASFVTQSTYMPTDLRERYAQAKVVILSLDDVPSASGLTVALEAMAMSTPLIVTKSQGIEAFMQDGKNSIVVPPESPEAIRTALTRVDDPDLYNDLAEGGRTYVTANHSVKHLTQNLVTLFSDLTKSTGGYK